LNIAELNSWEILRHNSMEITVVGHLSRDLLITPEYTREVLGGGTAYAMLAPALGALGCGIVSQVGKDFDQKYIDSLKMAVVDIDGLHVTGPCSTRFVNKYDETGDRTQFVEALAPPIVAEDFLSKHLKSNIIHFCPLSRNEIMANCFEKAYATDALISLDIQGYLRNIVNKRVVLNSWDHNSEILQWCHVVKADDTEIKCALGMDSEEAAASYILDLGPKLVIVTRDRNGSTIYSRDKQYDIPIVLAKKVVDATGSGDTYTIGFLMEYMRSGDIERAGIFGATCASFNLETIGPSGMPNRTQVEERMKEYIQA
jgi:sugar/nucleoside kinase (ribokinase family)